MANLITYSAFTGDIYVPSIASSVIEAAITKYEPVIMRRLLGYSLFKLLYASPSETKFSNLINGAEFSFEFEGATVNEKFEGLKNISAYYVYYKHFESNQYTYTGENYTIEANENASVADGIDKIVKVWSDMREQYGKGYGNKRDLDSYQHVNDKPSAYNFLLANKDTYPEWVFENIGSVNQFGI